MRSCLRARFKKLSRRRTLWKQEHNLQSRFHFSTGIFSKKYSYGLTLSSAWYTPLDIYQLGRRYNSSECYCIFWRLCRALRIELVERKVIRWENHFWQWEGVGDATELHRRSMSCWEVLIPAALLRHLRRWKRKVDSSCDAPRTLDFFRFLYYLIDRVFI